MACAACAPGKFTDKPGSTACVDCEAGKQTAPGATGATVCKPVTKPPVHMCPDGKTPYDEAKSACVGRTGDATPMNKFDPTTCECHRPKPPVDMCPDGKTHDEAKSACVGKFDPTTCECHWSVDMCPDGETHDEAKSACVGKFDPTTCECHRPKPPVHMCPDGKTPYSEAKRACVG